MIKHTSFAPEWISPPGETIEDLLEEHGWTPSELARRMGYTTEWVQALLNGQAEIDRETAEQLSRVLGSTTDFWLARERNFRLMLADQNQLEHTAEAA